MSKLLSPKLWYLVGLGAAALAFERVLRAVRKRNEEAAEQKPPAPAAPVAQPLSTRVAETQLANVPVSPASNGKPAKPEGAPAAQPEFRVSDDLTQIKGIGPTYARRLKEAGITTFAAIAGATPERLAEVAKATVAVDTTDWIAQARQMVAPKMN